MNKISSSAIAILAVIALASCTQAEVSLDPKTMFDPLKKGDKPDFIISEGISEQNNPFVSEKEIANVLSKYVPLYKDPFFNAQGLPSVQGAGPNDQYTTISADSFHKASVPEAYTWLVDHLGDAGLNLATKAQLQGKEDPLVYIEADGVAYIRSFADDIRFDLAVFGLRAYPGWVKITYNGTRKIPYKTN
jgi:hypothetical protein